MSTISIWGSIWEDVWVSLWDSDEALVCDYSTYSDGSIVPFTGEYPQTGDIYSTVTELLIGYRDPITFVYTPATATLVDDRYQLGDQCVIVLVGEYLVIDEVTGYYAIDELTGKFIVKEVVV